MSRSTVHIASDVHLGAIPEARARDFHRWLRWSGSEAGTIVINGDLFDFWFEYRHVMPRGHSRTLALLADLVDSGVEVHLTGGNHDWWGGPVLEEEVGVHFHRDPVELELAGRRVLVAHGDGLGPGDTGYKMLKAVIRSRPFVWAFRWLHPDIGGRVAGGVSFTEGRVAEPTPSERERSGVLEAWATEQLETREELGMVTLGHTHIPRRVEVAPDRWYLNSGDWVHHCSWVRLEPGRAPALLRGLEGEPLETR
ncbi:UDP-2,3-diacylglucosamine diphosphatase [Gaopeijia maritima]|uniref:UDP-2,3-diacylglucosamine diphosphatase n=1 Tax=Gaopeijia maritima TaxID=3119007 RepID=A0ABU9EBF7_9BACT